LDDVKVVLMDKEEQGIRIKKKPSFCTDLQLVQPLAYLQKFCATLKVQSSGFEIDSKQNDSRPIVLEL
jgi:hypothetical protein